VEAIETGMKTGKFHQKQKCRHTKRQSKDVQAGGEFAPPERAESEFKICR
jgi:hypothetical protein